jgi:flagellar basal-body rod protein FlgB
MNPARFACLPTGQRGDSPVDDFPIQWHDVAGSRVWMMGISDLQVVRAFREKLKFHGQRQQVLADNIANASTPGFLGSDLKTPDFFRMAAERRDRVAASPVMTSPLHMAGLVSTRGHFKERTVDGYEVTPDGNGVVLEEQMMKLSQNQMDYQVATSLYQRSIAILKTAVGRG